MNRRVRVTAMIALGIANAGLAHAQVDAQVDAQADAVPDRTSDHAAQLRRDLRVDLVDGWRLLVHDAVHGVDGRLGGERARAGGGLVEDAAEREHIRAVVRSGRCSGRSVGYPFSLETVKPLADNLGHDPDPRLLLPDEIA